MIILCNSHPNWMPFKWRVRALLFRNFGHDVDQRMFDPCQVKQSEASHVASNCQSMGDPLKVVDTFALQKFHKIADDVDDVVACGKPKMLKNGKQMEAVPGQAVRVRRNGCQSLT